MMREKLKLFTPADKKEEDKKPDLYYERLKQEANLEKARLLLRRAQEAELKESSSVVMGLLLEAIQLGSEEAGDELVRILFERSKTSQEMGLPVILRELERDHAGNAIAARCLGEIYAGFNWFNGEEDQLLPMLHEEKEGRATKAIHYLNIAITQGNEKARFFLSEAFRTGEKGCIKENSDEWAELNKRLADQGHQKSARNYALYVESAWKKAMEKKEKDVDFIWDLIERALFYFLRATKGDNWTIAHKAIVKICEHANFILQYDGSISVKEILDKEAQSGNPFVALYLAFAYCPEEGLPQLEEKVAPPPELRKLIIEVEKQSSSIEKTREYLVIASMSEDSVIREAATLFYESLNKVFPTFGIRYH